MKSKLEQCLADLFDFIMIEARPSVAGLVLIVVLSAQPSCPDKESVQGASKHQMNTAQTSPNSSHAPLPTSQSSAEYEGWTTDSELLQTVWTRMRMAGGFEAFERVRGLVVVTREDFDSWTGQGLLTAMGKKVRCKIRDALKAQLDSVFLSQQDGILPRHGGSKSVKEMLAETIAGLTMVDMEDLMTAEGNVSSLGLESLGAVALCGFLSRCFHRELPAPAVSVGKCWAYCSASKFPVDCCSL
jgi:acyl carrier protein